MESWRVPTTTCNQCWRFSLWNLIIWAGACRSHMPPILVHMIALGLEQCDTREWPLTMKTKLPKWHLQISKDLPSFQSMIYTLHCSLPYSKTFDTTPFALWTMPWSRMDAFWQNCFGDGMISSTISFECTVEPILTAVIWKRPHDTCILCVAEAPPGIRHVSLFHEWQPNAVSIEKAKRRHFAPRVSSEHEALNAFPLKPWNLQFFWKVLRCFRSCLQAVYDSPVFQWNTNLHERDLTCWRHL